jgi:hypothetical protein
MQTKEKETHEVGGAYLKMRVIVIGEEHGTGVEILEFRVSSFCTFVPGYAPTVTLAEWAAIILYGFGLLGFGILYWGEMFGTGKNTEPLTYCPMPGKRIPMNIFGTRIGVRYFGYCYYYF